MIRQLAVLAMLAALGFVALSYWDLLPLVDVKTVQVGGQLTEAERAAVEATVRQALAHKAMSSAAKVAEAVERMDWVRAVQVRRQWPDGLQVHVSRWTLAARWGEASARFLTTGGQVVNVPPDERSALLRELPVLKAAHASGAEVMRLSALLDELAGTASLELRRLEQDRVGSWTADVRGEGVVASHVSVVLGDTAVTERFRRFVYVFQHLRTATGGWRRSPGTGRIAVVDARYDTGVAVRWQEEGSRDSATAGRVATEAKPPIS